MPRAESFKKIEANHSRYFVSGEAALLPIIVITFITFHFPEFVKSLIQRKWQRRRTL